MFACDSFQNLLWIICYFEQHNKAQVKSGESEGCMYAAAPGVRSLFGLVSSDLNQ